MQLGAEHFQDLITAGVRSFAGNSLHFKHSVHWTQKGIIISETYTLMLASFCPEWMVQSYFHFV